MCEGVTIGSGFTSDWMRKWRQVFFKPITKRSDAKPKQMRISVVSEVKGAQVERAGHLMTSFRCVLPLIVIHFCRSWRDPCVIWRTVTSFQTFVELATCVKQILLRVQASGDLVFRR